MLITLFALLASPDVTAPETVVKDTLSESVSVSYFKQVLPVEQIASQVSVIYLSEMENRGLKNPKDFSSLIPNLHIPDYGSAMTSTVYLRGFGSRIDNPVIGMYIDDVPVTNKNSYDIDMFDIRRADFLRGPQSTLYGRNALCGVLALNTVSPLSYQGLRAGVEYGSANTLSARASLYGKTSGGTGVGASLGYRHSDGFYTNEYDGKKCDPYDALSLRLRVGKEFASGLMLENILSASGLDQGGYAYSLYNREDGAMSPVNYNDGSSYRRLNVTEAFKLRYSSGKFTLSSVTSWQYLKDRMALDQDFTPASMFTIVQKQDEHSLTQEFIFRPSGDRIKKWWNRQTGIFGFYRHNSMAAPVTMKRDGIDRLIIGSMPEPMRSMFSLKEDSFPIESDFKLSTYGAALFHESYFSAGKWRFTAGVRFDYEGNSMQYDSRSTVHYKFVPMIREFRGVETLYKGRTSNDYFEFIPRLSVMYDFGEFESASDRSALRLFATFSKGYKAGGFNTQIFSDILQNMMMKNLMADAMGAVPREPSVQGDAAATTSYLPETSFNYEVGGKFRIIPSGGKHSIEGAASVFYIDCRNQQITVFPDGNSTGRMMANAGKSGSLGTEIQLSYRFGGLSASASYGYSRSEFIEYHDGKSDYSGNRIPYAPTNTLNLRAGYGFSLDSDVLRGISVAADLSGTGKIWWDEGNTLSQPFYLLLGADLRLSFKWFDFYLRGDNITSTAYNVFYFESVGNSFFQRGKPARFTAGISVDL